LLQSELESIQETLSLFGKLHHVHPKADVKNNILLN